MVLYSLLLAKAVNLDLLLKTRWYILEEHACILFGSDLFLTKRVVVLVGVDLKFRVYTEALAYVLYFKVIVGVVHSELFGLCVKDKQGYFLVAEDGNLHSLLYDSFLTFTESDVSLHGVVHVGYLLDLLLAHSSGSFIFQEKF